MHESCTDIDGSMMMNVCVCLDGKSSDEDLSSCSRYKFWYSLKKNMANQPQTMALQILNVSGL